MDLHKLIVRVYETYYIAYFHNQGYRFTPNKNHKSLIDNFIKWLDSEYGIESIGSDFIIRYFDYQFWYWSNINYKNRFQLTWVIGKKAINRWKEEVEGGKLSKKEYFIRKDLNVDFNKIVSDILEEEVKDDIRGFEEKENLEKLKYYNTLAGFVNCIENTTMYRSCQLCFTCDYKEECKDILKKTYPKIYYKRKIID